MTGEREGKGRDTVETRLERVYPELCCRVCGSRRPRMLIGDEEYELDEDGEWVAVEN